MKIGVDARSLLSTHSRGEGKTLLQLYGEIARLRPSWDFVFFGSRGSLNSAPKDFGIPRSRVVRFDLPGFRWNTWENLGLPLLAAIHGVDVLHGFSSGGPYWCPVPFVMTVHDLIPIKIDDGHSVESIERFRSRIVAGLRNAEHVVAVSAHTRDDLLSLFEDVPAERVSVVHWGAPSIGPTETVQRVPDSRVIPLPNILAFGGGAKRKNTPAVVEMFSHVLAEEPLARLTMVGVTNIPEQEALSSLSDSLGISASVDLLGFVSEERLDELYRAACCVVYLSLYEGFGLPPLEAMIRGIPVVASNTSSIPEVVGAAGILVNPKDTRQAATAVVELIRDPGRRSDLAEKALLRAATFTWEDAAKKMIHVLERAAAR